MEREESSVLSNKPPSSKESVNYLVAEIRGDRKALEKGYRERALKMYPWICGRCAREFSGKKLKELTVHHRDHNHDNNPADGSNWELLCIYCHENEHARNKVADSYSNESSGDIPEPALSHQPFSALANLLKPKK